MTLTDILSIVGRKCLRGLGLILEFMATFMYHEMLKRNTLRPMMDIVHEPRPELQRKLLRQWARTKTRESAYIQLAVGAFGRGVAYMALTY